MSRRKKLVARPLFMGERVSRSPSWARAKSFASRRRKKLAIPALHPGGRSWRRGQPLSWVEASRAISGKKSRWCRRYIRVEEVGETTRHEVPDSI